MIMHEVGTRGPTTYFANDHRDEGWLWSSGIALAVFAGYPRHGFAGKERR